MAAFVLLIILSGVPETRYGDVLPFERRQSVPGTHCELELERTSFNVPQSITLKCTGSNVVHIWDATPGQDVEDISWVWSGDEDNDGQVDIELKWVHKGNWGGLLYLSTRRGKPLLQNQAVSEALAKRDRRRLLNARPSLSVVAAQTFLDRATRCLKSRAAPCWESLVAKGAHLSMTGVQDECLGDDEKWKSLEQRARRDRFGACMAVKREQPSVYATLRDLLTEGTTATAINRVLQAAVDREANARNHLDASAFDFRSPWQTARLRLVLEGESLVIDDLVVDEGC